MQQIKGFEQGLQAEREALQCLSQKLDGDRGRLGRVELDGQTLRENLETVAVAVSEGSKQTTSEIRGFVSQLGTLSGRLEIVAREIFKLAQKFEH